MYFRLINAALGVLALLAACVPLIRAQSHTAQAAPPQPIQNLHSKAEEVSLYLVVTDKHHHPVLDLRPSDLAVTDNGQPVALTSLHQVSSNDGGERLITLVFDRLSPTAAAVARTIAERFLNLRLGRHDSIAVFLASSRLMLVAPYTADRALLDHALDHVSHSSTSETQDTITAAEKQVVADIQSSDPDLSARARLLIAAIEQSQELVQSQRAVASLSDLTALARAQTRIPGRKAIVYFSQGLSSEFKTRSAIVSVVDEANRAGVTIFPVDVNALDVRAGKRLISLMGVVAPTASVSTASASPVTGAPNLGNTSEIVPQGMSMAASENAGRMESFGHDAVWTWNPLSDLAEGTGGIYIGTNPSGSTSEGTSIDRQLDDLRDNLTAYYDATYTPSIQSYDGQFRRITVRTLHRGLTVHTRSGYVALPPGSDTANSREQEALALLDQPQPPTDFSFRASILRLGALSSGSAAEFAVEVPYDQLAIRTDDNTHLSSIHVVVAARIIDSQGAVLQRFSQEIARRGSAEALSSSFGLTFQRHFALPAGEYVLESAISDQFSGKRAVLHTPFHIAEPAAGPALSDLILVRRTEPSSDAAKPLHYKGTDVVPAVASTLSSAHEPVSLFFLATPVSGAPPPTLELSLFQQGSFLGKSPLELSADPVPIPLLTTIKAGALEPGSYKAVVTLTQGSASVSSAVDFILPGTAPDSTQVPAVLPIPAHSALSIAASVTPAIRPSDSQLQQWLDSARSHALAYSDALPNFLCVESTSRSVSSAGRGDWKHEDTIVELVQYRDHRERRTPIEIDGQPTHATHDDLPGIKSLGEFGGILHAVFAPEARASFQWKESDQLDGEPLQVLAYSVPLASSSFALDGSNNSQIVVGYHGLVYIDAATGGVRRITMEADNIPTGFSPSFAALAVEYSYVSINSHDYLMPAHGSMSLVTSKHRTVLHEFDFRDYRRFGSQVRITPATD